MGPVPSLPNPVPGFPETGLCGAPEERGLGVREWGTVATITMNSGIYDPLRSVVGLKPVKWELTRNLSRKVSK